MYQDHVLVPYYNYEVKTKFLDEGITYDDLSDHDKERYEDDFRRYDIIDEDNYEINDINNYGRYEEEEHSDIDIDHIGDIDDFDD